MAMSNEEILIRTHSGPEFQSLRTAPRARLTSIIRRPRTLGIAREQAYGFRFDFGDNASLFGNSPASSGWRGSTPLPSCWMSPSSCPAPISATASTG
jgi:hypothetical protein